MQGARKRSSRGAAHGAHAHEKCAGLVQNAKERGLGSPNVGGIAGALPQSCDSVGTSAYIDTIEIFVRVPRRGLRADLEKLLRKRVRIERCEHDGKRLGVRIVVHQPQPSHLQSLHVLLGDDGYVLRRVDVAYDFDPAQFSLHWFERSALMRWRRPGEMFDVEAGFYFVKLPGRHYPASRTAVIYTGKPSKITGRPATHFELRFSRAQATRRSGVVKLIDLEKLDPKKLFMRHIKLVHYDPAGLRLRLLKRALKLERADYQQGKNKASPFIEKYRAGLPARYRRFFRQVIPDRVQLLKDAHPLYASRLRPRSYDCLSLPQTLSWLHPLH